MTRWPVFDTEEIEAVANVLRSGKVNAWTGPDVAAFEEAYCAATGARHAIAMANGSVTLDAALHALDLQPGDEVIVTPRSYIASASCVMLAGGVPVFADIDRDSQNITPETIAPLIGPRTRGILPVHMAGWPCDMDGILDLARAHDLWVIEDCAQAHGAKIGDRHVGTMGSFGSLSFCQDKIISTGGEGGMLLCNDDALWSRAWSFKDHGKGHATVHAKDHPPGFRWLHDSGPGTNLRMPGPLAAIGRIQLGRLDATLAHRTRNATILAETLGQSHALRVPMPAAPFTHAYYRFYAFVRPAALASEWSRDRIIAEITEAGIPVFSGSCSEIYREATFRSRNLGPDQPLPVARELGETSLAFLVDTTWSHETIAALAETVRDIADAALSIKVQSKLA
ncbi:UDP-4-amino-4-deoxy-L-arabinose--oxoglutarate aminotransferase [Roseivivax sp. THAF40]|uniref:DegT/DnrJ/EryC1/StrS family aminotransferase n=1 Tax=unclassified Roseivivax TaxID=2639302 RepID=UPI00126967A5|nr:MULTISPECIES: DegT/DnrJ/EryC1/StrS family aminotransferase [unclassified Roseivivax]QFS82430.1 UDP-4-amino-4-deoxy-L-arabinose--oxoglutarate aminotransferase [Roseivivax sp. THAF197b]QFT46199.1 UDP-4-amino-4-deoxy-L-arabinose--oxoglutarate aminotransferase [Roseivivax sp. THAF40]